MCGASRNGRRGIAGAHLFSLDRFSAQIPTPDKTIPLVVHCKSGYRSMIACSLLRKAGYDAVTNLIGGFEAWETRASSNFERRVSSPDSPTLLTPACKNFDEKCSIIDSSLRLHPPLDQ